MASSDGKSFGELGFLTVVEHEQHGLLGGYLVLNASGRPLEFHCTSGVRPNRAQEILFGPTLAAYLYGEQIGQTLVGKSSHKPRLICTDLPPVLAVRDFVSTPVVFVERAESTAGDAPPAAEKAYRLDAAHVGVPAQLCWQRGGFRAYLPGAHLGDETNVAAVLASLAETFDLCEPFSRIRGAIDEAQRGSK